MKEKVIDLLRKFALMALMPVLSMSLISCDPDEEEDRFYLAVDLGLSVKWAACNVGAEFPEAYGDLFAWGEVETKDEYLWTNYKWNNGNGEINDYNLTKYCTNSSFGTVDGKSVLDPEDDIAHVKWGGNWRMPTREECKELRKECTWEWTNFEGTDGYKVTGPNGNSIFLPAAGDRTWENEMNDTRGVEGKYWSSTKSKNTCILVPIIYFSEKSVGSSNHNRATGLSVRPVIDYEVE